jgi:CrcB protein
MIKDIIIVGIGSGIGGFCGGFTTFSTFSKEGLTMLQANNYILFSFYAIGSVVLGIIAVALGYYTTK